MAELGSRLLVLVLSILHECKPGFSFSAAFSFLVGMLVVLPLPWFSATFWTEDKLSAIELIVFLIFLLDGLPITAACPYPCYDILGAID